MHDTNQLPEVVWKQLDGEWGWTTYPTLGGVATVKLGRGYPRSRKYRIIVNGNDVERFVKDPDEAKRIAEAELRVVAGRKMGFI